MPSRDLVPVDPQRYARDKAQVEQGLWRKVRRTLGLVPFAEDAVAAYYCGIDPATPLQVKAILIAALAYFVMPADMIPDFIAGFGFTDDAAVLAVAIRSVAGAVTEAHRARAHTALGRHNSLKTAA